MIHNLRNIFLIQIFAFFCIIGPYDLNLAVLNEDDIQKGFQKGKLSSFQLIKTIVIQGNDDFLTKSLLYNWQGNGSESNPFIIKDYVIHVTNKSLIGINIQNTNFHFRIENVTVSDAFTGLFLYNVANAYIYNNSMTNNVRGFNFMNVTNTRIESNVAELNSHTGFELQHSDKENLIINNKAFNNSYGFDILHFGSGLFQSNKANGNSNLGFRLFDSDKNHFIDNTISSNQMGIGLFFSNYNNFINNSSIFNDEGYFLESDSNNNYFINNTASKNNHHGFIINWGSFNEFKFNTAINNEYHGFAVYYGNFNLFVNNYALLNSKSGYFLANITQNNNLTLNYSCANLNNFNNQSQNNIIENNSEGNSCKSITSTIQESSSINTSPENSLFSLRNFTFSIFLIAFSALLFGKFLRNKNSKK